jgi:hypothetical protein
VHFLNNLVLGRGTDAPVFSVDTTTNYTTSDYNAFSLNGGSSNFGWGSPPPGVAADFDFNHKLVRRRFKTLKEYSGATGQDVHSVMVGYDVFMNVPMADVSNPQRLYDPEDMDFRLKPNSPASAAGLALATINDGYQGKAPDLGAYQAGQAPPHYGPRSWPTGDMPLDKKSFRSWDGPPRAGAPLVPQ